MYKNKEKKLAVKKDENDKLLLAYDIEDDIVREETEGILREVDTEVGEEIAKFFKIKLDEYGVTMHSDSTIMS